MNSRTKEARPEDFMPDWHRFYMRRAFDRGNFLDSKPVTFNEFAGDSLKVYEGTVLLW